MPMIKAGACDGITHIIGMHIGFQAGDSHTIICGADKFLASTKFENYDDDTVGANIFAEAAIETVLDERYADIFARLKSFEYQEDTPDDIVREIDDDFDDLFIEKLSSILG